MPLKAYLANFVQLVSLTELKQLRFQTVDANLYAFVDTLLLVVFKTVSPIGAMPSD